VPNHSVRPEARNSTAHDWVLSHGKAGWGITVALLRSQSRSPVAPGAPVWGTCSGPGSSVNAKRTLTLRVRSRRFPPPWIVEDIGAAFVVKDSSGQELSYVYYEENGIILVSADTDLTPPQRDRRARNFDSPRTGGNSRPGFCKPTPRQN
jgi:hypothetical protein